jgi:hypothetical protein
MKFGLRDFDRSLASGFAVDGETQRFPKLDDPEWQKLRYLQGFPRSASAIDPERPNSLPLYRRGRLA